MKSQFRLPETFSEIGAFVLAQIKADYQAQAKREREANKYRRAWKKTHKQ